MKPPSLPLPSLLHTLPPFPSPQFRQANRDKAIREVKERAKKVKADKAKASKQAPGAKAAPAPKAVGRGKR
jgi:large subunit ribosomal protein L24e